ncbi:Large-conductance mechanosensitive channel [Dissostichus eleginoides]|uniref:Large-conductance mechanosensitive channel n=1 Tax=Dissostichus eleginoides TaxID=100907 RepID=A0AAD9BXF2_DISEL|nr:Large-conductance mechanosensitive channel [Dissostichus eleginoides]
MEAGAEASPPQQQRRKPVQHGLEDQKRSSVASANVVTFIHRRPDEARRSPHSGEERLCQTEPTLTHPPSILMDIRRLK